MKPQKWSKPNEAVAIRFTAYTNRGGYFILRLPSGQERQVWVEQIVGGKPLITPDIPSQIINSENRNKIQSEIDELKQLVAKVPSAAVDIAQHSKALVEAVKRYDSGEVCVDGYWKSKEQYRDDEFLKAQTQLRESFSEYSDKTIFNIKENYNYKKLNDLSQGNSTLQTKTDNIRFELEKQIVVHKQIYTLERFKNPNICEADARLLLIELRSFKNPTEETKFVLQQAENAIVITEEIEKLCNSLEAFFINSKTPGKSPIPPENLVSQGEIFAEKLTAFGKSKSPQTTDIEKLYAALESYYAKATSTETPPTLPTDLISQREILAEKIAKFHESSPPKSIRIPEEKANALILICRDLPKVSPLFGNRNFLEAAALLTHIVQESPKIGPNTEAVCKSLFTSAVYKVVVFEKLVYQGDEAEKNGKFVAAKTFFTDALKICHHPILESRVKELIEKNPL